MDQFPATTRLARYVRAQYFQQFCDAIMPLGFINKCVKDIANVLPDERPVVQKSAINTMLSQTQLEIGLLHCSRIEGHYSPK